MIYAKDDNYILYQGKMQDVLKNEIENKSIDCIITDPPYELNFMNKGWDNSGVAFQKETWENCFNALKDGGYLLAFGGTRTYHRIACAIEDAGFEIRDCIMWLYGSGFPKSMAVDRGIEAKLTTGSSNKKEFRKLSGKQTERGNYGYASISKEQGARPNDYNLIEDSRLEELEATTDLAKQWKGWGTALKPSYEPIIVARKPFKSSLVENIIDNKIGGLNIDECRISFNGDKWSPQKSGKTSRAYQSEETTTAGGVCEANENGRFPANVILTYDEEDFSDVCSNMIDNETGLNASRYFYCAKASKKDRDDGLEEFEEKNGVDITGRKANTNGLMWDGGKYEYGNAYAGAGSPKKNFHPTCKPVELMQYLVRLVAPPNATILDCFMGSGSTGKAVMFENRERNKNYKFIGIEMTEEYLPICKARIYYAKYKYEYDLKIERKKDVENGILSIFDFMEG